MSIYNNKLSKKRVSKTQQCINLNGVLSLKTINNHLNKLTNQRVQKIINQEWVIQW